MSGRVRPRATLIAWRVRPRATLIAWRVRPRATLIAWRVRPRATLIAWRVRPRATSIVTRALALILLLAHLFTAAACTPTPAPITLTVGLPALEQSALLYLAADQGLFARHGLNVILQDYATGRLALEALQADQVDIAGTAEYPLVRLLLQGQPLAVLTTVSKFENDYVVARPGRGIAAPADLRGKRVGLAKGTIVEFYLARLLELQGIPADAVTVVDYAADSVVTALVAGEVDAIVTWQPHVSQARAAVAGAIVLPAQSSQPVFGVLVGRQPWATAHPDQVARFLAALAEAEDLLRRAPEQAQAVVRQRLGYDAAYLAEVWPQQQFSLSLDQALVIAMKDEAQWMIRNGLTPVTVLPDLPAAIYTAGLEAVKPGAVTLVR